MSGTTDQRVKREWVVKSNSFKNDYEISGDTLEAAIVNNIRVIMDDAVKGEKFGDTIVSAKWLPDILNRHGGVEVIFKNKEGRTSVVWIYARVSDLLKPIEFKSYHL